MRSCRYQTGPGQIWDELSTKSGDRFKLPNGFENADLIEQRIAMSVPTLSPAELLSRWQAGALMDILDVRTPAEFREVHVSGSRNLPLGDFDPSQVMQQRSQPSQPLYVICRSGSRGQQAAEQFHRAGYTNVVNIEGGTLACIAAGFPVIRGKKGVSLERQVRIAAGSFVLLGVILGTWVHPAAYGLSAFIGAGLLFSGITDTCGMGMILAKLPWNRVASPPRSTPAVSG
jgi:rhodanese-related sulfurtransferase